MQTIEKLLKKRLERGNLDVTKHYEKIEKINGTEIITYVGQFIKSYRMGSGDGMSLHWEFNDNGKIITIDNEMWGSINGDELCGFRVVE
jgi:hypothetical protein